MRKNALKLSLALLLPLLLNACFSFDEVEIKNIKRVNLKNFSKEGIEINAEIQIVNPNGFSIKIVGSEFDLYLKGDKIGTAVIKNKIKIPSNSEDYHLVELVSDPSDMSLNAIPTLLGMAISPPDRLNFRADGYIVCKVFFFRKKIEVEHQGMVPFRFN